MEHGESGKEDALEQHGD